MLNCEALYEALVSLGGGLFAAGPDALLQYVCAYIAGGSDLARHVLAATVGGAVALGTGQAPYALVVRDGTSEPVKLPPRAEADTMAREQAIALVLDGIEPGAVVV